MLRLTQATIPTENPNFQPWLLYFFRSLQKQIERLEFTIKREQLTRASIPKLADEILQLAQQQGKISASDIIQATNALVVP